MKKQNQLTIRMLRGVMLLMTLLLVPIGALAEDFDLWVSGQQVTNDNLTAICSDQVASGSITFDGDHTLTFTNVPWNSFNSSYPFIQTSMDLTIHLVGISQPDMGNVLIQRMDGDNETHTLTFTTDPDNPGMFLVRGGSLSHEGFTVVYENGLAENPSGYYAEAGGNYPYAWIAQTFLGGAGTSESPYLIKSAADLKLFSDHFNEGAIDASASVQLYNDINCEEMEDFAPIGDYNNSFAGTFDGNNKVISNLTATDISGEEIGLFRYLATNGTIQNLTLDNFTLSGGSSSSNKIGAFVAVMNGGTISNCQLSNSSISCLQNTQNPTVGGIVGQLLAGSVTDCIVDGSSIKAQTSDEWASGANANAGGIVGALTGGTVSGCQVKGATTVLADYADYGSAAAGAIVANNNGGTLANNTYEYTVTVTEKSTAKSGYEQRGIGGTTYNSETEADESIPDITTNNGAVMYTQKLTIVGLGDNCGIEGVDGYEPLADPENHIYYFAPGQETAVYLYPDETYEVSVALTYSETSTTINKDAEEDSYKFTMPDAEATLNVTLTAKQSIWIGGIEVNEGVFPDVTGAAYDAATNTLTLTDFEFTQETGNAIEFGIEGLKVHLVGENTITCHDQSGAAFKSLVADNTITFSAEDDESRLTMATLTPYSNLTASYNGKLVYIADGDYKYVMPIEAPYLGVSDGILMMNAELLPEGAQCFYAIDYADETLTDVELTAATSVEGSFQGPEILGPCTVTSYMKAGTAQSSTVTGKYFGFAQTAVRATVGTEGVKIPAVIPAIAEADGLTVSCFSDEDVVTISDGMIVPGSTIGTTTVSGNLQTGTTAPSYEILNTDGVLEDVEVYVVPAAPTFDSGTGNYEIAQLVEISNPNTLEGYTTKIFYQIDNGDITEYTEDTKPYISQSAKLLAWIDVYDGNDGLLADLRSDSTEATYTIAENYNLYVGGVLVHEWNKDDIFGEDDGEGVTAMYDPETTTLTLNGATIATESGNGIDSYVDELTIHLVGNSTMNHQIWMSNGVKKLKFTTSDETPGKLTFASDVTKPYEASGVTSWSKATYQNGLTLRRNADNAYIIALDMPNPQLTNSTDKLYYPDATFALAIESDNADSFDIYYSIGTGEATKYTEPFTIEGTSNATIYTYSIYRQYATDGDYKSNTHSYLIRRVDKPTFTPAGGTYDEAQTVKLENLPENISANTYPQVWYYLGENKTDSIQYTAANQEITVESSTKVCVYVLDEDSGKVYKSEAVESQYVIRQSAELSFVNGEDEPVSAVSYTIGKAEAPTLPELQNIHEMEVAYSSSNTAVATVNATTGEVTIKGVGETTISASSEATDVYVAGSASYTLTVYKNLSHESISVTVADATYTGEEVTPEVTVMDGETDITEMVTIAYSNNVNVGSDALVTITPSITLPTNYYVGSATQTFTIMNRTLQVGEDVTFGDGQTWATFYTTAETLELPEGINAYVVTAINGTALTLQAISQVPKNVPVLLEQSETQAETNDSYDMNLLRGTSATTSVTSISSGTVYVLYKNNFVKSTSGSIPAGRAYLVLEGTSVAGAPSMLFFGDETLGIRLAGLDQVADDAVWYTLEGRKLQGKPTKKGLYILNGKKIVVK